MSIQEQLQNIYESISQDINIDKNIARNITEEHICIIIHAVSYKQCRLNVELDVFEYLDYSRTRIIIEQEFENMNIIVMLYIIKLGDIRPIFDKSSEVRCKNKQVTYKNSDIANIANDFGIIGCSAVISIINVFKIDYESDAENNIKNYLNPGNSTKSANKV